MSVHVAISVRAKIGQMKVKRYWTGKAPEWAEEVEDAGGNARPSRADVAFQLLEFPRKDDPRLRRLRRLAESRRDTDEAVARHRQIRHAEIVSTREEEKAPQELADAEDDEAIEERRQRIRKKAKLWQRQQEEEAEFKELEEDEEGEESEYESPSEESRGMAMAKAAFVPKSERVTIAEREKREAEEELMKSLLKKKLEERRIETKQLVVEEIRKDEEIEKNREADGDEGEVDTDDEGSEEEREACKVRGIARIEREEKLRNLTGEERREWEKKNPNLLLSMKKKRKFMQKYYHKGAFFQTESNNMDGVGGEEIFKRDFSAPTGEDRMDKTILPKVMPVKKFGLRGRTKWTHLVAEDTTHAI